MPAKGNFIFHLQPKSDDKVDSSGGPPAAPRGVSGVSGGDSATKRDVDHLVKEIKENLKLGHFYPSDPGSGGKLKSSRSVPSHLACHRSSHRSSPYAVPPSSRVAGINPTSDNNGVIKSTDLDSEKPSQLKRWNQRRRYPSTCMTGKGGKGGDPDDPFQMLQELISDGSLIKEAVRRLQLGLTPKYNAAVASGAADVDRSFYDSDDECRTPPAYPELLCEI